MSVENSTNVRSMALRSTFALLQGVAPGVAARAASRLFLRTPRGSSRPSSNPGVMEAARPFELSVDGGSISGWRWGSDARTVLLVHGWGGRASQMRHFVQPLRARGFGVVAFDAPGHGASPGTELSLPAFAAVLRRVAAEFGRTHAVIAHSFGAAATAVAIAEGLSPERAVFIGPPSDELRWFERFSEHLRLSERTRLEAKAAIEERVGAPFSRFSAEALGPDLNVPLLVLHDRLDREVPWDDGARIARSAPRATLVTTEGLGHRRILRDARVIEGVIGFVSGGAPELELHGGCRRCGGSLEETWEAASELCMSCELHTELSDRSRRWDELLA